MESENAAGNTEGDIRILHHREKNVSVSSGERNAFWFSFSDESPCQSAVCCLVGLAGLYGFETNQDDRVTFLSVLAIR